MGGSMFTIKERFGIQTLNFYENIISGNFFYLGLKILSSFPKIFTNILPSEYRVAPFHAVYLASVCVVLYSFREHNDRTLISKQKYE